MRRLAIAALAALLIGTVAATAVDRGPWSEAPEPVPAIRLDVPDATGGAPTAPRDEEGATSTTRPRPTQPAPEPDEPEIVPPPTFSSDDDDDDLDEADFDDLDDVLDDVLDDD